MLLLLSLLLLLLLLLKNPQTLKAVSLIFTIIMLPISSTNPVVNRMCIAKHPKSITCAN